MKKLISLFGICMRKLKEDHISAYAAQAAYFIIMSAIPFLMLLLSMIKFTPLTKEMLNDLVASAFPSMFQPLMSSLIDEMYKKTTAVISLSAIIAIWSSGRGILAITRGFNLVYDVKETRNYIMQRLRSAMYTMVFLLTILVSLVLMVFGESINRFISHNFTVVSSITEQILNVRLIALLVAELVIFILIYKWIPNRKGKLIWQLPGAVFSSVGWNLFSYLFSIYVEKYSRMSYTYGSLSTLVVVMLWMNICMYIIFIGAELNAYVEQCSWVREREERNARKSVGRKQKKREKQKNA